MLKGWQLVAAAALVMAAPASALAARGYATSTVNMRAGPSTEYPVVATVPDDARVNIHGCLSDHDWCDVTWRGNRGWVSARYLDYFYSGRYVYLPSYFDEIDVPVVTFALGPYWDSYYTGRPWYGRRAYWEGVWRAHGRYGFAGYRGGHRHAGQSRPAGPTGPGAGQTGHRHVARPGHNVPGERAGRFSNRIGHAGGPFRHEALPGARHEHMQFGAAPGRAHVGGHAGFGGHAGMRAGVPQFRGGGHGGPHFGAGPRGSTTGFAGGGAGPHFGGGRGGGGHFGGGHVGGPGGGHVGGPGPGAMGAAHGPGGGGGGPHGRH